MNKITTLMIVLSVAVVLAAPQAFAASISWPTSPNNYYNGYYNTLPPKVAAVPTPEKVCTVDYGTPGHVSKYVTSSDPELARTPGYSQVQMASVPSTSREIWLPGFFVGGPEKKHEKTTALVGDARLERATFGSGVKKKD